VKQLGVEKLLDWLKALDERTTLLAFGVDLRRYAYFQVHTPAVGHVLTGGYSGSPRQGVVITEDVFQRCYRFVIDTALTLGAEDYDFDPWETRRRQQRAMQDGASEITT
jgi:hypothetical protein